MTTIKDWQALELAMETLAITEAKIAKTLGKYEVKINDLKKESERAIADNKYECEDLRRAITAFSMKNKSFFESEPTKKFKFGTIALKTNPEKITQLEGWTEEESLEKALDLKGDYKDAIVTTFKFNKDVLKTFTIKALEKIGLQIVQGETLTIKPKKVVLPE